MPPHLSSSWWGGAGGGICSTAGRSCSCGYWGKISWSMIDAGSSFRHKTCSSMAGRNGAPARSCWSSGTSASTAPPPPAPSPGQESSKLLTKLYIFGPFLVHWLCDFPEWIPDKNALHCIPESQNIVESWTIVNVENVLSHTHTSTLTQCSMKHCQTSFWITLDNSLQCWIRRNKYLILEEGWVVKCQLRKDSKGKLLYWPVKHTWWKKVLMLNFLSNDCISPCSIRRTAGISCSPSILLFTTSSPQKTYHSSLAILFLLSQSQMLQLLSFPHLFVVPPCFSAKLHTSVVQSELRNEKLVSTLLTLIPWFHTKSASVATMYLTSGEINPH